MIWVFFDRWSEIGVDTLKYYTFTEKSAADFGEFWVLFFTLAFFHESSTDSLASTTAGKSTRWASTLSSSPPHSSLT